MPCSDEASTWPPLPYEAWRDTGSTLHLWLQVAGKSALVQAPGGNHSWHLKSTRCERVVREDEQPIKANPDKITALKPAFRKDGTVTATNASSISDGAAALVLMRLAEAEKRNLAPLARIVAHATHAQEPRLFTTSPVFAIRKVLEKAGWSDRDVDLYEINEAFAVVTMAAMRELDLSHERVNVHGGACALGHPIGASGTRIVVTLLAALAKHGLKRGVAALCIGGGEATALAVERIWAHSDSNPRSGHEAGSERVPLNS